MAFGATGKLDLRGSLRADHGAGGPCDRCALELFPDADVNSNPANPIINTRSFGEDPQQVGDLVAAYIRGARADGMMVTIKHFPGHGIRRRNSHLSVAQVTGDKKPLAVGGVTSVPQGDRGWSGCGDGGARDRSCP